MRRWLAPAGCIAVALAVALGPNAAQFVFVLAAVALIAAAIAVPSAWQPCAGNAVADAHGTLTDRWLQLSVLDHESGVVRLVLLSQPRR